MLKILENTKLARLGKGGVKVGDTWKGKLKSRNMLDGKDEIGDNEVDNINKVRDNKIAKGKDHQKIWIISKFKKMISFLKFFTLGARLAFIK